MIFSAYHHLLPLAQHVLPASVKARLVPLHRLAERFAGVNIEKHFARRPIALRNWQALLPGSAFEEGPVVMANDALGPGGAERQIVNTFKGIVGRMDVPVHILCTRLGEREDFDFFNKERALSGAARNVAGLETARLRLRLHAGIGLEAALAWMPAPIRNQVIRYAGEFINMRPSVVHAWQDSPSIAAGVAARMVGIPRIIISGRNLAPSKFAYFKGYMRPAYCELAGCPSVVMVNNSVAGAVDYAEWLGIPVERIVVVRNGLDLSCLHRSDATTVAAWRKWLNIPANAPIVGSMFRFYDEKRPLLWIEAAAKVSESFPGAHFIVFGNGPRKEKAASLARRLGLGARLHLPGAVDDVADALSLFDVFLLTSKFEGTPNVVLEATSLGVPVVATDAGGTRETIQQGVTGLVADDPSPAGIASLVVSVLRDPDWRNRVAGAAPAFLQERFGQERMIEETLALYGLTKPRLRASLHS